MPVPSPHKTAALLAAMLLSLSLHTQAADDKETLRADVAKPLQAAQELIKAGKFQDALGRVKEAESVVGKTPYESFITDRMKGSAAMALNDAPLALKAFEAVVNAGRLSPAEQQGMLEAMASLAIRANDPAAAIKWARRYQQEGGQGEGTRAVLAQALFTTGDYAGAGAEAVALVNADESQGRKPAEDRLRMLAYCQLKTSDDAAYMATLERLVTHYPKADYWSDLLPRIQHKPGFQDRMLLDVFRLMRRVGVLEDANEYLDMAQLSILAGLPAEARDVIEEGYAKGVLGTGVGTERHKRMRDNAHKLAKEDQAQLLVNESQVKAARDGAGLVTLGQALVSYGMTEQGIQYMSQGLAKGIVRHPDDARLHLGVAQLLAGQRNEALNNLKGLKANDGTGDLARLWPLAVR